MARYVAFLRAVNVGSRRVQMAAARTALEKLGFDDVSSHVNSGNLLFTATGRAVAHETAIRTKLEGIFEFEVTTFVRTAAQVKALATNKPFGPLAAGHTHFALLTLRPLTAKEKKAVKSLSNDHDEVRLVGRDIHWLIHSKSTETTLGPKAWKDALPDNATTARNTTMLAKLAEKL